MSVHRIAIFDRVGNALYGADLHHGADQAAAWVAETLAKLAAQGTEATALEIDVDEGGDHARTRAIECHTLALETRRGAHPEIVGVFHRDNKTREGRALRILGTCVPGGQPVLRELRGQAIEARAARWGTIMGGRKR